MMQTLIQNDKTHPKRLAIVGDTMLDEWLPASLKACQDGCAAVLAGPPVVTPGGAANAAAQLERWSSTVSLIGPVDYDLHVALVPFRVDRDLTLNISRDGRMPRKQRFVAEDGRVLFRADYESVEYGLSHQQMAELRDLAVKAVRNLDFDGLLLADYGKGFLDEQLIGRIIRICNLKGVPVVADPKRPPGCFKGAVIKANMEYACRHLRDAVGSDWITTCGEMPPLVNDASLPERHPVLCRNHVGAGDCFGIHLLLALTHGWPLREAAQLAHAAGRVYVQHEQARPPWPHEIARDLDPLAGKVMSEPERLRASLRDQKIVFTNGVFRLPHAGHAWLLDWAKRQGDVLVVGINDDESARALRNGQKILPLAERIGILAGLTAVDWIIPFTESDPCATMAMLRPDVLVKGSDYAGQRVPGSDLVGEVRFAPASPFSAHSTDMVAALQSGE